MTYEESPLALSLSLAAAVAVDLAHFDCSLFRRKTPANAAIVKARDPEMSDVYAFSLADRSAAAAGERTLGSDAIV